MNALEINFGGFNGDCLSALPQVSGIFNNCTSGGCCDVSTRSNIRTFVFDLTTKCDFNQTIVSGIQLTSATLELVCEVKRTSGTKKSITSIALAMGIIVNLFALAV